MQTEQLLDSNIFQLDKMKYSGNIVKMSSEGINPVNYFLKIGLDNLYINSLIGKALKIRYKNQINCIYCDAITKTSFHQGYCCSCFVTLPQCDVGVLSPEKDLSHLGISRDMEWSKENSLIDHYVYIAYTGDLKVGVTRHTQIPTRWIDQGAIAAIKLAKTPNRYLAGVIETELKKHISDKTNWIKMLQTDSSDADLLFEKKKLAVLLSEENKKYLTKDNSIINIKYPYHYSSSKFSNISLDKNSEIEGVLEGIKGQYLVFNDGQTINIRKHNGYFVEIDIQE